mmetsp:Transcript_8473/g.18231  ORF Transcript_8473/g.18231 Transcript_8473/m.18231 type:complete len:414 (-) Transcript_8473:63-1304(-)
MGRIVAAAYHLLLIFLAAHFLLVAFLAPHASPLLNGSYAKDVLLSQAVAGSPLLLGQGRSESSQAQLSTSSSNANSNRLGAIVLLAAQRSKKAFGHVRICLLRNALQSIDAHLNAHYGPYDIFILVASDYYLDPERKDGPYSDADRAALTTDLPHSPNITFIEIPMYSGDALEANLDLNQFERWYKGLDGGTKGRHIGYRSMCRLWSGRLQRMEFIRPYKYIMRMDDDSLLTAAPITDPFLDMELNGWKYAYRQPFFEAWGYVRMWEIAEQMMTNETKDNMVRMGWLVPPLKGNPYRYIGAEPYNNFHIATVSMWSDPRWLKYQAAVEADFGFFKHRFGDANIHAIATGMLLKPEEVGLRNEFPYVHNINGMPAYQYELRTCEAQLETELKAVFSGLKRVANKLPLKMKKENL